MRVTDDVYATAHLTWYPLGELVRKEVLYLYRIHYILCGAQHLNLSVSVILRVCIVHDLIFDMNFK